MSARRPLPGCIPTTNCTLGTEEVKPMRRHLVALTCIALPLAAALAQRGSTRGRRRAKTGGSRHRYEVDALDRKADPCIDFYQFACGGWVAKNPVAADRRSVWPLRGSAGPQLRGAAPYPRGAGATGDRKKAADYYAACMDESTIDAAGLTPVRAGSGDHRRAREPRRSPGADGAPARHRRPRAVPLRSQTDLLGDADAAIATWIRPGSACPIATTT